MSCVEPTSPLGIAEDSDEFHNKLIEDSKGISAVVMAMMMESMLMQRLEESKMGIIMPMQAMKVFVLDAQEHPCSAQCWQSYP
jgi:hypothetical protein